MIGRLEKMARNMFFFWWLIGKNKTPIGRIGPVNWCLDSYPPGNDDSNPHYQGMFEDDDFPFHKVGYVSSFPGG